MYEKTIELLKLLKPIINAVDVNDGDTLSSLTPDYAVIWQATGSWSSPVNITLGDLRKISEAAKSLDS